MLMSNGFGSLIAVVLLSVSVFAQVPAALTPADTSAIQALMTGYAQALAACRAEEYADLFAPDTGYFASGIRRLRTSGVAIAVAAGAITGHAYLKNGGYYEDVYEKIGPGQWRIKSHRLVAATAP
jgi:hypothetical protein